MARKSKDGCRRDKQSLTLAIGGDISGTLDSAKVGGAGNNVSGRPLL